MVATGGDQTVEGDDATFTTGPLDLTSPQIVILGTRAKMSRKGVIAIRVKCPESEPDPTCAGRLRLKTAARVRFRDRLAKLTLGKASFEVRAGSSARIPMHLARAKRRLVAELGRLKVRAIAKATDAAGNTGVARKLLRLTASP